MAYVVGFLSVAEERILVSRGWEMERCPRELVHTDPPESPSRFKMVWVDASMFDIMNGPDWGKDSAEVALAGPVTHSKPKTRK